MGEYEWPPEEDEPVLHVDPTGEAAAELRRTEAAAVADDCELLAATLAIAAGMPEPLPEEVGNVVEGMHDGEAIFWAFVCLRQQAWHRRHVLGLPRSEWTADPVIARARFTNVYRALDRGTQYAVGEVLETRAADREVAAAALLIYRLFNRIPTFEALNPAIGYMVHNDKGDAAAWATAALRALRAKGDKLFTGAYQAPSVPNPGGLDAEENLGRAVAEIAAAAPGVARLAASPAGSMDRLYTELLSLPGFGRFMAYQAAVDMTYPVRAWGGAPLAPNADPDAWCQPGPGAERGLLRVGVVGGRAEKLKAMQRLRATQRAAFASLGLDFPFARRLCGTSAPHEGWEEVELGLPDIEHSLCEFHKYMRISEGGHVKSVYPPEPEAGVWRPQFKTLPAWGW